MVSLYCDDRDCDYNQGGYCNADDVELSCGECETRHTKDISVQKLYKIELQKLRLWNKAMASST